MRDAVIHSGRVQAAHVGRGIDPGADRRIEPVAARPVFILITCRSAPSLRSVFAMVASSPSVRPWRTGIGITADETLQSASSTGPSTCTPVTGFGRSST